MRITFAGGIRYLALAIMIAVIACSSGSSSKMGAESLSTLPSTSTTDYDFSTNQLSVASSMVHSALAAITNAATTNTFSRMGCETGDMHKRLQDTAGQVAADLCRFKMMEKNGIEIPKDSFAYYRIEMPSLMLEVSGQNAVETTTGKLLRIGKFGGTLKFDMCDPVSLGSSTFQQAQSSDFAFENNTLTATVQNKFQKTLQAFSAPGMTVPGGTADMRGQLALTVKPSADGGKFDFSTAAIVGSHQESFTPDGGTAITRRGTIELDADASTETNVLKGAFSDGGRGLGDAFSHQVIACWNKTAGSAKYSGTGRHPAFPCPTFQGSGFDPGTFCCETTQGQLPEQSLEPLCPAKTHEGTESFSITATEDSTTGEITKQFAIIASADSPCYSQIESVPLPDIPTEVIVTFNRDWDCTPEGDWTVINVAEKMKAEAEQGEMRACEKFRGGMKPGDGSSCGQQKAAAGPPQ